MAKKRGGSVVDAWPDDTGSDSGTTGGGDGTANGDANPVSGAGSEPEYINGYESVDPASGSGDGDSGAGIGKRRRGRQPGSKNKAKTPGNLTNIEGLLLSLHMMGAAAFSMPELMLADEEAKHLGAAIKTVAEQYNQEFNPVVMAWLNLAVALGGIYGTRFIAIRMRLNQERARKVVELPVYQGGAGNGGVGKGVAGSSGTGSGGEVKGARPVNGAPPLPTPADVFGVSYTGTLPDTNY